MDQDVLFQLLVFAVAALAGGIASVAGFGIGSILTPLLWWHFDARTAIVAVSIPHLCGTLLRFVRLRAHLDVGILRGFGLMNALGALAGALLHTVANSPVLAKILGGLLLFAGTTSAAGWATRMRFRGKTSWAAGALSGAFGGLVGNQGGIRAAAMLGLGVRKEAFVATATAIALAVDAVRMPIYFATGWHLVTAIPVTVATATAGVLAGTLGGEQVLRRIPENRFRRLLGVLLLVLGLVLLTGFGRREEQSRMEKPVKEERAVPAGFAMDAPP